MGAKCSYNILLADDHVFFREVIRAMIEKIPELKVVGEVGDGFELLEFLKHSTADMVISDLSMPNMGGIEATKKIKGNYPGIKVLITTMHKDQEYQDKAILAGAEGFLPKDFLAEGLIPAIRMIRNGETYNSLYKEGAS